MIPVNITVNGKDYNLEVKPYATLLELIREDLQLTGAKEGCGVGECGACTILMEGKTVNACLVLAAEERTGKTSPLLKVLYRMKNFILYSRLSLNSEDCNAVFVHPA